MEYDPEKKSRRTWPEWLPESITFAIILLLVVAVILEIVSN